MKTQDVLVGLAERKSTSPFVVIRNKSRSYRADPDPNHHKEDWENAWVEDISNAHVFTQKEARKFLQARAGQQWTEMEARRELQFVDVEVVDGVPRLPQAEKKGAFSWLRSAAG